MGRGLQSRSRSTCTARPAASAAGARSASSTSSVPTYSYFMASEIGPSGTSAALTMSNGCPVSTAVSIAISVAPASKGTSRVTSMTGLAVSETGSTLEEAPILDARRITRAEAPSSAFA